jgi:hypothetical protein
MGQHAVFCSRLHNKHKSGLDFLDVLPWYFSSMLMPALGLVSSPAILVAHDPVAGRVYVFKSAQYLCCRHSSGASLLIGRYFCNGHVCGTLERPFVTRCRNSQYHFGIIKVK